jgi:hypothetical protein
MRDNAIFLCLVLLPFSLSFLPIKETVLICGAALLGLALLTVALFHLPVMEATMLYCVDSMTACQR